ncbi:MAG TPA: hypothetical protein VEG30_02830 [Terriglobales bacterium]|nr:hypothetical protein [Terriglobales bacterium]
MSDQSGNTISGQTVTFSSSNPGVVTLSSPTSPNTTQTLVNACGGIWDSAFVDCQTGQSGSATITASTSSITATVTIFVHPKVDTVKITPTSVDCVSNGSTTQFTVQALSGGTDVTSLVGSITWQVGDANVASIDTNGVTTAKNPGKTQVFASVGNITSAGAGFVTCAVQSIHVHVSNAADTTFSLSSGTTVSLTADMVDSKGVTVTGVIPTWNSTQPAVATVSGGTVSAVGAGVTGIGASCSPPSCNSGFKAIFSNLAIGTVSGTTSTTVYATGTSTTSLVPIDATANTAGTAITLPNTPNSFVFNKSGTKAYLGSANGLMSFDTSTNTVTTLISTPGTVIGVSPDGNKVLYSNSSSGAVFVYDVGSNTIPNTIVISGNPVADYLLDSSKAFIVSGTALDVFSPSTALQTITLGAAANSVAALTQGSFFYLAGGVTSSITARASCDGSQADAIATAATPSLIGALPNGTAVLALDPPKLEVVAATTDGAGCPPTLSDVLSSFDTGQGSFTPRQIIFLPDSSKAYIVTDQSNLIVYNTSAGTTSTIPLANGAVAFSGGVKLDGSAVYVGGSDNTVHRIDTSAGTDAQQISVSFTPDLVAVRPK